MARKIRTEGEDAAIDMTPMLDIVFIMLIFFIVTTSFVKEAGIEVVKPEADTANRQKNANIFIAVNRDGDVWMDKRQIDKDSVQVTLERLLSEQPTDVVIIQADEDAEHGIVIDVMDQVKAAGINSISIAAEGN
jgi:biopolymer transport protein ExbD